MHLVIESKEYYIRSKEDIPLEITLLHGPGAVQTQIAEMVAEYWHAIGVGVELEQVSGEELRTALEAREYEAALVELSLSLYPDPDPYPLWHDSQAESGQNYSGFTDRNSGIWIEQARTTTDRIHRAELYRNFQHRFLNQVPAILLYHPVYNYTISAEMSGVSIGPIQNPSDRFRNIHNWFLLDRRSSVDQGPSPVLQTPLH